MLALLGITFVASLSGDALVKGLIAGGLGFFLATVGMDPILGHTALYLWPAVSVGRHWPGTHHHRAVRHPEIDLAVQGRALPDTRGKLGGVVEGVKDTFRHWSLVLRCSAIGAYIGLIPGMGGGVSRWLAYAHAASSPQQERFGKGAIEGVLGPGARTIRHWAAP